MPTLARHRLAAAVLVAGFLGAPTARSQPAAGSLMPCPTTGEAFEGDCACWAPRIAPVWGTDIYAGPSAICAAAVHSGIITMSGGTVRVVGVAGQARYAGTTRHGVVTQDGGAAPRSFRIERGSGRYGAPPGR